MTVLIDGKLEAEKILATLTETITKAGHLKKRPPALAVILVGNNPASELYVHHKEKACIRVGIQTKTHKLPATASQKDIADLLKHNNTITSICLIKNKSE